MVACSSGVMVFQLFFSILLPITISVDHKVSQEFHSSVVSAIRNDSLNSPQNLACGNLSAISQSEALRDRKHSISESDRRLNAQKEELKPSFSRQYAGVCDLLNFPFKFSRIGKEIPLGRILTSEI